MESLEITTSWSNALTDANHKTSNNENLGVQHSGSGVQNVEQKDLACNTEYRSDAVTELQGNQSIYTYKYIYYIYTTLIYC